VDIRRRIIDLSARETGIDCKQKTPELRDALLNVRRLFSSVQSDPIAR